MPAAVKIFLLAIISLLTVSPLLGQKVDTAVLFNRNFITGEIQQLSFGILDYSTDDMGTVEVKWEKIGGLE